MRKLLVSIGVIILVIILPAGSWYYLQTGLNYRKEALEQLKPKGNVDLGLFTNFEHVKSKTVLVQMKPDVEVSKKIFEQFGSSERFSLYTKTKSYSKELNWLQLDANEYMDIKKAYPGETFILIDTAAVLRNTYQTEPSMVAKDVVSHLSMVLPRKKDKDIKMKSR